MRIDVPGFTYDPDDGRAWTADLKWGLAISEEIEDDEELLVLLDGDGMPSDHALTEDEARHVVSVVGLGPDLRARWDSYASSR